MMNGLKKHKAEWLSEGAELVACECPICKMVSWHKSQTDERKACPFCSSAQPDYLVRIVPESVTECETAPEDTSFFSAKREIAPPGDCEVCSPFVLEFFMVQGSGFRCMAYRNQEGKWHGAFDDEELPGAIRVLG